MTASHTFTKVHGDEISVRMGEPLGVRVLQNSNGVQSRVSSHTGEHQIFVETLTYERGWVPISTMSELSGNPFPDTEITWNLRKKICLDIARGCQVCMLGSSHILTITCFDQSTHIFLYKFFTLNKKIMYYV